MGGNFLVPLMLYSVIPVVFYVYQRYPAQRAVVISFIFAWLFLPVAELKIPGIPAYSKISATCYGILLATAIFDSKRFSSFRLSWIDVPMLLWCFVAPFMSSVTNGLGGYDGFSWMLVQTVTWGIPYFLGRIYLNSFSGLRQLAIGIFVGGLVYVPFIWFENRTYASLHLAIYGLDTGRDLAQSFRLGGYRAQVFMEHGLMVGVWMMTACIMGVTLWRTRIIKSMWGQSMGVLMIILLFTFINCRSTGAYNLFIMGAAILFIAWRFRNAVLLWVIVLGIMYYVYLGASGNFPGKQIVASMSQVFEADRVASLQFRFENEDILGAKARQQALFGWGRFGRSRVFNEVGEDTTVTDSLWIITFGLNGVFGLITMFGSMLLPVVAFCIRYPAKLWKNPMIAPAAALSVCVVLYTLDCVLNAMVNPIFMLAAGGIAGVVVQPKQVPVAKPYKQLVGA